MISRKYLLLSAAFGIGILGAGAASAATITSWNLDNVVVGATDGTASASKVYDGDPSDPTSTSNGQIAYAPPEAVAPGIKVQP